MNSRLKGYKIAVVALALVNALMVLYVFGSVDRMYYSGVQCGRVIQEMSGYKYRILPVPEDES